MIIRWVSHPGIFNWACKWAQYGFPYTHCDTKMPDGSYIGARLDGGVQARPHDYDAGQFLQETFIELKCTSEQEKKYYDFLRAQIGKPYDSISIAAFFVGRDWQEPDSWDCSELKAAALAECGIFPQHMAVSFSRITPRDLMLLTSTLTEDR